MTAERASRRSSDELRELLLETARREYAEKGYAGASNRDVVRAAGVTSSVLYRHFPSKADLFAEAVLAPFVRGFEQNGLDWLDQLAEPLDDEALMRQFIRDIYLNIREHRNVLEPLMLGPGELSTAAVAQLKAVVERLFKQLRFMTELEARRRGWFSEEGADMMIRMLVGMVMGISAFGWLILPDGEDESDPEAVIDNMVKIGLWGIARHPPADRGDGPR